MRVTKRIVYVTMNHGVNWFEGYGDASVEEYPGELDKLWWVREIPSLVMLIILAGTLVRIFGPIYLILIMSFVVPILLWSFIVWFLNFHTFYHNPHVKG